MDLRPYIDDIGRQLEVAAEAGGEDARALAQRLIAPLDAAVRLSLLDALSVAAQEITCELAPGSVEVRLRDRNPEFAVMVPGEPAADDAAVDIDTPATDSTVGVPSRDEGGMARINLRMPEHLKGQVDDVAAGEGISVNAWLVRAVAAGVERADSSRHAERRSPPGPRRVTGWAR